MFNFLLVILSCSQGVASDAFFKNLEREAKKLDSQEQALKSPPSKIGHEKGLETQFPKIEFKKKKQTSTTFLLEEFQKPSLKNEGEWNCTEKNLLLMPFLKNITRSEDDGKKQKCEIVMKKFEEAINNQTDTLNRAILLHNRAWFFEKISWRDESRENIERKIKYWESVYQLRETLKPEKKDNIFFYSILNQDKKTEKRGIIQAGKKFSDYSERDQEIIKAMYKKCGHYLSFYTMNINHREDRFGTIDAIRHKYLAAFDQGIPKNRDQERSRSRDQKDQTDHKTKRRDHKKKCLDLSPEKWSRTHYN